MAGKANKNKIHVPASERGFGLGFGAKHSVDIYTQDGPKTGALLTEAQCESIGQWNAATQDQRNITEFVTAQELTPALGNQLLHADTIELVRLVPKMLEHMTKEERAAVFTAPIARVAPDMWEEIAQTRPRLLAEGFDAENPQAYFDKLLQAGSNKEIVKITDKAKQDVAEAATAISTVLNNETGAEIARKLQEAAQSDDKGFSALVTQADALLADVVKATDADATVKIEGDDVKLKSYLTGLSEALRGAAYPEDVLFNGVSVEILATLLPVLFETQEKGARAQTTQIIAKALHTAGEDKGFFGSLADLNLNRLVITDNTMGASNDVINNGRTLMIRSANGPKVKFHGDDYTSGNLHFHPLKNANADDGPVKNAEGEVDANPEFRLYKDAAQAAHCKKNPHLDPNNEAVGQLHTIYVSKGKRAMLLGADVKLGDANPEMGKYIDLLKAAKGKQPLEIIDKMSDAQEVAAKAVPAKGITFDPLACYNGKFDADGVPQAPFMSLHLGGLKVASLDDVSLKPGKSDVFYRGVRVIHLPEAITISAEQLKDLRALQPVLKSVDEDTCVHPKARFQVAAQLWKETSIPAAGVRGR